LEPVLDIGLHDFVLQSFHQIFDCARAEQPGYQQVLGARISGLLADSSRLSRHHDPISEDERLVERAKFLLADNITEQMDIGWLSHSLGIGYSRFRTMFKNQTGLSPYQYFLNLKIGLAKQLLEQGNYSIKEISHMLSFDDPYYFSHLFKKKTGLAPSRWKPQDGLRGRVEDSGEVSISDRVRFAEMALLDAAPVLRP
jgi:AraC-like DNA-binding protein